MGVGRSLAVGVLFGEEEAALGGVVPGGEGGPGVAGEVAPGFMGLHAADVVVGVFHGIGAGAGGALALAGGVVGVGGAGAVGEEGFPGATEEIVEGGGGLGLARRGAWLGRRGARATRGGELTYGKVREKNPNGIPAASPRLRSYLG